MSEELRSRVAAEIRRDLAEEAAAGFPLLRRFPDSETACVPGFFAGLSPEERESLLDGLAFSATHQWSFQFREDLTQAFPVLRGLQMRSLKPLYPEYDWYGGRPKKAKLKRAVADALKRAGFARRKRDTPGSEDWMEFSRPEGSFPGYVGLFFDPGFPRQIDYGWRDWLRPALSVHFPPIGPRNSVPAVTDLNYETLWRCAATSNPYCWDVITEANLEETLGVLIEALERLAALATRINALDAPSA